MSLPHSVIPAAKALWQVRKLHCPVSTSPSISRSDMVWFMVFQTVLLTLDPSDPNLMAILSRIWASWIVNCSLTARFFTLCMRAHVCVQVMHNHFTAMGWPAAACNVQLLLWLIIGYLIILYGIWLFWITDIFSQAFMKAGICCFQHLGWIQHKQFW